MGNKEKREGKITLDLPDSPYEEGGSVVSEKMLAQILLGARLGGKSRK